MASIDIYNMILLNVVQLGLEELTLTIYLSPLQNSNSVAISSPFLSHQFAGFFLLLK